MKSSKLGTTHAVGPNRTARIPPGGWGGWGGRSGGLARVLIDHILINSVSLEYNSVVIISESLT